MRKLTKNEYVLSGIFALTAMFPLATASDGASYTVPLTGALSEFSREAFSNRTRLRQELIECRKKLKAGTVTECENVNPSLNGKIFLRTGVQNIVETGSSVTVGGDDTVSALEIDDLSTRNQSLLRRFIRTNKCPRTLNAILPGFYELCLSVTHEENDEELRGFLNDRVKRAMEENKDAPTLEDRIKMFKGMRPDR